MTETASNLVSLADRSPEKRQEIARKGGLARAERMRARKAVHELARDLLDSPAPAWVKPFGGIDDLGELLPEGSDTIAARILITQLSKALSGDLAATKYIFDLARDPGEEVERLTTFANRLLSSTK